MRMKALILSIALLSVTTVSHLSAGVFDNAEKLSLELEAVPLAAVLNMIAEQNELNLVLAGDVGGEVTIRLESVNVEAALEAILHPNGYNFYVKNDIIIVKPIEMDAEGELVSEVVTLKYLDPTTAKSALESLSSSKGKIVILDKEPSGSTSSPYRPNTILITDFPCVVKRMLELIRETDQQERLISIEVKIIETKIDDRRKLGLSWPTAVNACWGHGKLEQSETTQTSSESTSLENIAANWNPNTGSWTWGTLSVAELRTVLDMLEQNDNSKLISDPHITTLENHEAVIKIQTIIPIPTVTRFTEGAATQDIQTFYDEEIGISVIVTPRINEEGKITLDIAPRIEDIIGYTGSEEAQKPITISRSIKTRITVGDGETAALGGLLKNDVIEREQKIPLLGSIPLLGKLLFTSKSREKSTTDLIILITPKIMQ